MVSFALGFVLGVWGLQQLAWLPALPVYWPLALLGLWLPRSLPPWSRQLLLMACAMLLGFSYAAVVAQQRLADGLPAAWQGRDIEIVGVVAEMPRMQTGAQRFLFDVEQTLTPQAQVPQRLLLTRYAPRNGPPPPALQAGQRWHFTVRLKQPHSTRNPYTPDFELWALERDIRATGYVHEKTAPRLLDEQVPGIAYGIERLRGRLSARILDVLADAPHAGIIAALAIGDQSSIPQESWRLFTRTGINHLMSISGLHITMLSGLFFALTYHLWRRIPWLTLRLPARKAATLTALAVALAYSLLSGFDIPAQRTFYMLAAFALMLWSSRTVALSQMLAIALLAVLLIDPWAVLAPGFWLSFGAVALILYVTAHRLQRPHWLVEYGKVQWAMTIGLIPLLLAWFQQLSLVSPLTNAFAIPLIGLLVVPATLLGTLLPLDWSLHLAHGLTAWCIALLQMFDQLPFAVWTQHAPPSWSLLPALLGVLWLLAPRGIPLRPLGAILLAPLFIIQPDAAAPGTARIHVFDVGQGLSVAVQTAHHNLLFDTGPDYPGETDSGSRILVPALRGLGVERLDVMILSHGDLDHVGGTLSVLQAIPTDHILSALRRDEPRLDGHPQERCMEGDHWEWDGVRFDILHPAAQAGGKRHDNDHSCVLAIRIGEQQVLLTGDIERRAEAALLSKHATTLFSTVLVAPHHGSRSSSAPAFVQATNPQYVVFTAGYRNRFHHPHPEVVQRYRQQGAELLASDVDGALRFELDGQLVRLERYRQQARRYWTHTPQ